MSFSTIKNVHRTNGRPNSHLGFEKFLQQHPSVRFLRLQWQDISDDVPARAVPLE